MAHAFIDAIADASADTVKFQTQIALAGNIKMSRGESNQWIGCDEMGLLETN
jgi:sialic acid synthase SpsE